MKKTITFILALLFVASASFAEDIYYAQSSAGGNTGANCANAKALSALTWGGGAGSIDAGDTAHLCGTITSGISVGTSGSAGSPVTVKWEDGAKMSNGNWGTNGIATVEGAYTYRCAIGISGKTNVVVDGGTNGIIEATDTGTSLGSQQRTCGVFVAGTSSNIEIKNLSIDNTFVRAEGTDVGGWDSYGVLLNSTTGDNVLIHDLNIQQASSNIKVYEVHLTGVKIYNNTLEHSAAGMNISSTTSGQYFHDAEIYGNTINLYEYGSDSGCAGLPDLYHGDQIHSWHYNGATMDNVSFYGNYFGPNNGTCMQNTADLFIEGHATNISVYNNLFIGEEDADSSNPTNGMLFLKCSGSGSPFYCTYDVYNNTFSATTAVGAYFTAIAHRTSSGSSDIQNNVFVNLRYGLYYEDGTMSNNNNLYYNISSSKWWNATTSTTYSPDEVTYYIGDPLLDASFAPQVGSDAIDHGVDLSAYFTTDYIGTSRPQGGVWDIGAYEYDLGQGSVGSFSFTDNTDAAASTVIYSDSITVSGSIASVTPSLTGTGCFYQVNGAGSWLTSGDNVVLGDNVALKTTSLASASTPQQTSCTLTLTGGSSVASDTWFVTTIAVPNIPTLVSPTDDSTGLARPVTFSWSSITGASLYQIQIATDSAFTDIVIDVQTVNTTYEATTLLPGMRYYWRVRALQ